MAFDVGWRSAQHPSHLAEACSDQLRVRQVGDADRDVNPLFDEIYNPVEQEEARLHGGIGVQKRVENGPHVELSQSQRRRDREQPARLLLPPRGVALGLVERTQHGPASLQIGLAELGQFKRPCAPVQQLRAQLRLQERNCARHLRWRAGKVPGGRCQGATVDRSHERPHRINPVHCCGPCNQPLQDTGVPWQAATGDRGEARTRRRGNLDLHAGAGVSHGDICYRPTGLGEEPLQNLIMARIPDLMRAALAEAKGEPLAHVQVATPQPGPGEVLVQVAASAVNPLDAKILAGTAEHARQPLPAILGIDMAGVVVRLSGGVNDLQEGDAVFGMVGGVGGVPGSLAEYMAVDARLLARKPANLTMREVAALPLVFITAWEGLVDRAGIKAGQHALIQGGAGGVGQMALQIARAHGAIAFASGSPSARTAIEALGAEFVDRAEPVADVVNRLTGGRGFDIVFDTAGGASLDAAFLMVRRNGHVVSALGWGTHGLAPLSFRAASYSGIFTLLPLLTGEGRERHGAILAEAARLAEAGELVPRLDPRRFTLGSVNDAYRIVAARAARGKLVVDVAEGNAR